MSFTCKLNRAVLNRYLWRRSYCVRQIDPVGLVVSPTGGRLDVNTQTLTPSGLPKSVRRFKTFSKCYLRGGYAAGNEDDFPSSSRRRRSPGDDRQMDDAEEDIMADEWSDADKSHKPIANARLTSSRNYQPDADAATIRPPSKRLLENILQDSASFESSAEGEWSTPRYPASADKLAKLRLQGRHGPPDRPDLDPQHATIILFPGQGAQFPGMAKSLLRYPNVRRMFDVSSEILGYDLLDVCLNSTRDELSKTIYCQPATVVASLAALEKLKDESPHAVENCTATAGFSVGEITSLIFAGAFNFEDGMKLVRIRAEAMQAASEMTSGGMMTVFYGPNGRVGFACKAARELCIREGIEDAECLVANYLYPGCKVLSGHEEALDFIAKNARDFGIDRHKRLRVSGAFHSRLMSPARDVMVQALRRIPVANPLISVYSNVEGKPYRNPAQIQRLLPNQLCVPVKWEQVQHALYERPVGSNFPQTYECGPGRALQTVLQRVNAKAYARSHVIDV